MKLRNLTAWSTRDLRALIVRALRAQEIEPREYRSLRVEVVYARSRCVSGCAYIGRVELTEERLRASRTLGHRMTLRLRAPWRGPLDPREVAAVAIHEAAHLRGVRHRQMEPSLLYCYPSIAEWAAGMPLRHSEPKKKPRPGDEQKLAHAQALALAAERKVARWQRRLRKLRTRVRYYERKMEKAAGARPQEANDAPLHEG